GRGAISFHPGWPPAGPSWFPEDLPFSPFYSLSAEERTPGLPVGAVAGIVTGVLVGVALVAALGCFLLHTRTGRAGVQQGLRDHRTPASTASQGPPDSSTSLAPVSGHKTAIPIYQELLNPDLDIYCRVDHTAIGGS
ncbi:cell adhesion molecule CEACAM4-like, partial [Ictidomys tridecemlineatus]